MSAFNVWLTIAVRVDGVDSAEHAIDKFFTDRELQVKAGADLTRCLSTADINIDPDEDVDEVD